MTGEHLRRIGLVRQPAADLGGLRTIVSAHARQVPFENLDIVARRPLSLDVDDLHDKIVRRRRGGFCYELNGLLHVLLRSLGFEAVLVEARSRTEAGLGPRFDHVRVIVKIDGRRWLADVGNGASATLPLPIDQPEVVDDGASRRRIIHGIEGGADGFWTQVRGDDGGWEPEWFSTGAPITLAEVTERCRYHETDPSSHFAQGLICTLPTPTGKVTLTPDRLITTGPSGQRHEAPVDDVRVPLADVFGIRLDPGWPDGHRLAR